MTKVKQVIPRRETTLYTAEFRAKAVAKYLAVKDRKSQNEVADSLGVQHETFRKWVKKARQPGRTVSAQMVELRAEVDRLRIVTTELKAVVSQLVWGPQAARSSRGAK